MRIESDAERASGTVASLTVHRTFATNARKDDKNARIAHLRPGPQLFLPRIVIVLPTKIDRKRPVGSGNAFITS
jgi:hypothetical protein